MKPVDEPLQHMPLPAAEEIELNLCELLKELLVARSSNQASEQPAGPPIAVMQQQINENALRAASQRFEQSRFGQLAPLGICQSVDQFRDLARALHFRYERLECITVVGLSREVEDLLLFSFEACQS